MATLEILSERWGDTPLSLDELGRAQEFSLRYATEFVMRDGQGKDVVPRQVIELSRDYIAPATDSRGNVYTTEVDTGKRAQRFRLTREQRLREHYAKTLDIWADALQKRKDDAIAIQSEEVYDRYMKYLTGCADLFRNGQIDVVQFTLEKSAKG